MKVLVIDNYDSFVYNIVHYLEALNVEVVIKRNDELSLEEVVDFERILISPGPGLPKEAGIIKDLVAKYCATKSILGICLGQQAIAEVFGCELKNLDEVYHGVSHPVFLKNPSKLFKNLPHSFNVGRYHSWVVKNVTDELIVTATDKKGEIMAIKHKKHDVEGVQFHPESVLTEYGQNILANWLGIS